MLVITGATGQLGRMVIAELLQKIPASKIVAAVRNVAKAADLATLGIQVRHADYSEPASLESAFKGADKVLLISSSEVGQRAKQHQAVIDAAKKVGVGLLAYTSILHADSSPLLLAEEHRATEQAIAASGLPAVILRNGWYSENYTGSVKVAVAHGVVSGCAADGRLSTASRADYAAAAAVVLLLPNQAGKVYELAGDNAFTLAEYAATIAAVSGHSVQYQPLSQEAYAQLLQQVGIPAPFAAVLADSEAGAAKGGLFDDSHQLSALIGRATTDIRHSIVAAL